MNFHLLSLTEIPKKHEEIPNGHKEKMYNRGKFPMDTNMNSTLHNALFSFKMSEKFNISDRGQKFERTCMHWNGLYVQVLIYKF